MSKKYLLSTCAIAMALGIAMVSYSPEANAAGRGQSDSQAIEKQAEAIEQVQGDVAPVEGGSQGDVYQGETVSGSQESASQGDVGQEKVYQSVSQEDTVQEKVDSPEVAAAKAKVESKEAAYSDAYTAMKEAQAEGASPQELKPLIEDYFTARDEASAAKKELANVEAGVTPESVSTQTTAEKIANSAEVNQARTDYESAQQTYDAAVASGADQTTIDALKVKVDEAKVDLAKAQSDAAGSSAEALKQAKAEYATAQQAYDNAVNAGVTDAGLLKALKDKADAAKANVDSFKGATAGSAHGGYTTAGEAPMIGFGGNR